MSLATKNNKIFDVTTSDLDPNKLKSQEFVHLDLPESRKSYDGRTPQRRRIHRVQSQLRQINHKKNDYDPAIVSLGPYHHGKPELRAAEEVKHRFLDRLTSGSDAKKSSLHSIVLEKIHEIRACYADDSVHNYDDTKLATMIMLDASFIVAFMEGLAGESHIFMDWHQCLGAALLPFAITDMLLLENQIPFHVVKQIVALKRGEEGEELIQKFLNWILTADFCPIKICINNNDDEHPIHLLEACHMILVEDDGCRAPTMTSSGFKLTKQDGHLMDATARSATDLKAKGIRFMPSRSGSVRDIKFKSGRFRGELQLPVRMVWSNSVVALANLIAYEMSPGGRSGFEVVSYTNLLKSLIESGKDVKELQEKGILINRFQIHQQVVEELKGVCTFGIDNFDIFKDVRMQIEEHCGSRAKTWIADLVHTRFRTPWTVTALLAAFLLLCLTFLQTYEFRSLKLNSSG